MARRLRSQAATSALVLVALAARLTPAAASGLAVLVNGAAAVVGSYSVSSVSSLVLDTGAVRITLGPPSMEASSVIIANGTIEVLRGATGASFYVDAAGNNGASWSVVRVLRLTATLAEVALVDTTGSPLRHELHYILQAGVPAFYYFHVLTAVAPAGISEVRFNTRWNRCTLNHAYNHERGADFIIPTGAYLATQQGVQDSTWRVDGVNNPSLPCPSDNSGNVPNGYVYTKYQWSLYHSETPFFGHYGAGNGRAVGVFLTALSGVTDGTSAASYGGGPLHQDLAVHHDAIICNYMHRNHYGSVGEAIGPGFSRLFGPFVTFFVTRPNASDAAGLLADASAFAASAIASSIPALPWMADARYPPAAARANVTGVVVLPPGDARPPDRLWVCVTTQAGAENLFLVDAPTWFVRTGPGGAFTIPGVPPGNYTLYVWPRGGAMEGLRSWPLAVPPAAGVLALGNVTYAPTLRSTFLWSIGVSDGEGGEFALGNATREWTRPLDVPGDLTYTIGSSWEAADWYYAQTRGGTWTVAFSLTRPITGTAVLTFSASMSDWDPPSLSVNGAPSSVFTGGAPNHADSTLNRQAVRSGRQYVTTLSFAASRLRVGANTLTLSRGCCSRGNNTGTGYDMLLLEADEAAPPPPAALTITAAVGAVADASGGGLWTLSLANTGAGAARQVVLEAATLTAAAQGGASGGASLPLSFPGGTDPSRAPLPVAEEVAGAGGGVSYALPLWSPSMPCVAAAPNGSQATLTLVFSANGRRTRASTSVPYVCGSPSATPSATPSPASPTTSRTQSATGSRSPSSSASSSASPSQVRSFSPTPRPTPSAGTSYGAASVLVVRLGDGSPAADPAAAPSSPVFVDEYAFDAAVQAFALRSSAALPCAAPGASALWGAPSVAASATEAALVLPCWVLPAGGGAASLDPPPAGAAVLAAVNTQGAVSARPFPAADAAGASRNASAPLYAAAFSGGGAGAALGVFAYATGPGAGVLGAAAGRGGATAAFGDATDGDVYRSLAPLSPAAGTNFLAASVSDGTQVFVGAAGADAAYASTPAYVAATGDPASDVRSSSFDSYASPTLLVQADNGLGVRLWRTASAATMFAQLFGSPAAPSWAPAPGAAPVVDADVNGAAVAVVNGVTYVFATTPTRLFALNWATQAWVASAPAGNGTQLRGVSAPPRLAVWVAPTPSPSPPATATVTTHSSAAPTLTTAPSPAFGALGGGGAAGVPFAPLSIIALRVGDASGAATDTVMRQVYLDELVPAAGGGLRTSQTIALTGGGVSCVAVPSSTAQSGLQRAGDGASLVFPCFNATPGSTGTLSSSNPVARLLGQAFPDGTLRFFNLGLGSVYYSPGAAVTALDSSTLYAIVSGGSANGDGLRVVFPSADGATAPVYSAWRYSGANAGIVAALGAYNGSLYLAATGTGRTTGLLVAPALASASWEAYLDLLAPSEVTVLGTGALPAPRAFVVASPALVWATDLVSGLWRLLQGTASGGTGGPAAWLQDGPYTPVAASGSAAESAYTGVALSGDGATVYVCGARGVYGFDATALAWAAGGAPLAVLPAGSVYRGIAAAPAWAGAPWWSASPTAVSTATAAATPSGTGTAAATTSGSGTAAATPSAGATHSATPPATATPTPSPPSTGTPMATGTPATSLSGTPTAAPSWGVVGQGAGVPFVPSSVIALRVGDASGAATDTVMRQVYLDELVPAAGGGLRTRQTITLTGGGVSCVAVPSSTAQSGLQRAGDGASLVFPCFNATPGSTGTLSSSNPAARLLGQAFPDGTLRFFNLGLGSVYYSPGNVGAVSSATMHAAVVGGSASGNGLRLVTPSADGATATVSSAWRYSGANAGMLTALGAFGGSLYFATTGFTVGATTYTGMAVAPSILGRAWTGYVDWQNAEYPGTVEVVYLNTAPLPAPRGFAVASTSLIWATDVASGVWRLSNATTGNGSWAAGGPYAASAAESAYTGVALSGDGATVYVCGARGVYGFDATALAWAAGGAPLAAPPAGSVYRGVALSVGTPLATPSGAPAPTASASAAGTGSGSAAATASASAAATAAGTASAASSSSASPTPATLTTRASTPTATTTPTAAAATAPATPTATAPQSASPAASSTTSLTPSATRATAPTTTTASRSHGPTPTRTPTASPSSSPSASPSASTTPAATGTGSASTSAVPAPPVSPGQSASQTRSAHATSSGSHTPRATATTTRTARASPSASASVSPSASPSASATSSASTSSTPTASLSPSLSMTSAATAPPSLSAAPSPTSSTTASATAPPTAPRTPAPSAASPSRTPSHSPTATKSPTRTPTGTATRSRSPTGSRSGTRSPSATRSSTRSPTRTRPPTASGSSTRKAKL